MTESLEGGNRVKSYALAIALAMLVSAIYAFQNAGDVTVRFLVFEQTFPQGMWEVLLFAAGAILMWLFSLLALLEVKGKHKTALKEKEKRIAELEEERASLLAALKRVAPQDDLNASTETATSVGEKSGMEAEEAH